VALAACDIPNPVDELTPEDHLHGTETTPTQETWAQSLQVYWSGAIL